MLQSYIDNGHWSTGEFIVPHTFEERLRAVEERMDMESGLRASIDRDLSNLSLRLDSANTLIQAVALTQSQHTRVLWEHTGMLREHTGMLKEHTGMLKDLGSRLDRMDDRFDEVIGMLKARES